MKVSMARVRLFLKEGKTLSDGSHPIMLSVAFNGKCTRSTGYSCTSKFWDKKSESVKRGYPNFSMINFEIQKLKNEVISSRNTYERSGEPYTAQMLLKPRKVLSINGNDLKSVISRYLDEKGLEARTIEKWWIVYRSVVRFAGYEVIVSEIDESFCRRYARWCEGNGLGNGSIRSYLGKIGAICHYAIEKGLMSSYPFSSWKYHLDYRESKSELYIHHRSMSVMIDMFLDEVIVRDGSRWHYKEGVEKELLDIHSELYSHYLYIVGYVMCGLSPVDISMLKKSDIKVMQLKGRNCYAVNGYRSKTGMPYKLRIEVNTLLSNVVIRSMMLFNPGEYFLPTLGGYVGKDIRKRINNVYTYHGGHLVDWFVRVNGEIARINVENGHKDDIPLIDLDCRYYSYRHSYVMSQIQKPGVNLVKLATETGKSVKTIHQYVSLLNDEDLV